MSATNIEALLGQDAAYLLEHTCTAIPEKMLHIPGPEVIECLWGMADRGVHVLASLRRLFGHGRLGGTGYLSLLPVDHGIAHTAGMVFAPNPAYLDPDSIVRLGVEGGCSGIVTTYGVLGAVARKAAHRIPLVLKINHDEQFAFPARYDNILFTRVQDAWDMGCVAVAATVYFGGPHSRRQLVEISRVFAEAHALGLATILFCYLHPVALQKGGSDIIFAADLTAQSNHLGVTIEADLVKQKQPLRKDGYHALGPDYGVTEERVYTELMGDHPIDWTRYQVANGYLGRSGLIHSGGASGQDDLRQAVRAAVINKRGGGMGLLAGRKVFQVPLEGGVALLHTIQDVYLDGTVTLA